MKKDDVFNILLVICVFIFCITTSCLTTACGNKNGDKDLSATPQVVIVEKDEQAKTDEFNKNCDLIESKKERIARNIRMENCVSADTLFLLGETQGKYEAFKEGCKEKELTETQKDRLKKMSPPEYTVRANVIAHKNWFITYSDGVITIRDPVHTHLIWKSHFIYYIDEENEVLEVKKDGYGRLGYLLLKNDKVGWTVIRIV